MRLSSSSASLVFLPVLLLALLAALPCVTACSYDGSGPVYVYRQSPAMADYSSTAAACALLRTNGCPSYSWSAPSNASCDYSRAWLSQEGYLAGINAQGQAVCCNPLQLSLTTACGCEGDDCSAALYAWNATLNSTVVVRCNHPPIMNAVSLVSLLLLCVASGTGIALCCLCTMRWWRRKKSHGAAMGNTMALSDPLTQTDGALHTSQYPSELAYTLMPRETVDVRTMDDRAL